MSGLNITLPNEVIVGVAYNTANQGYSPLHINGPYDSLNVGVPKYNVANIGLDKEVDAVFWNTSNGSSYTGGGIGGTFRKDTGWAPYGTVALRIETTANLVGPATNKDQCKGDRWKTFNNPTYKNQGDCVSAVASKGKAKGNPPVVLTNTQF